MDRIHIFFHDGRRAGFAKSNLAELHCSNALARSSFWVGEGVRYEQPFISADAASHASKGFFIFVPYG